MKGEVIPGWASTTVAAPSTPQLGETQPPLGRVDTQPRARLRGHA
jgi:hypothetical protein